MSFYSNNWKFIYLILDNDELEVYNRVVELINRIRWTYSISKIGSLSIWIKI